MFTLAQRHKLPPVMESRTTEKMRTLRVWWSLIPSSSFALILSLRNTSKIFFFNILDAAREKTATLDLKLIELRNKVLIGEETFRSEADRLKTGTNYETLDQIRIWNLTEFLIFWKSLQY